MSDEAAWRESCNDLWRIVTHSRAAPWWQGDFASALQAYHRALQIDPNYTDAYNNRGCLLAEQGKYPKALTDFDTAIRLNPREAIIFSNRGRGRRRIHDALGARADFTRSVELKPQLRAELERQIAKTKALRTQLQPKK